MSLVRLSAVAAAAAIFFTISGTASAAAFSYTGAFDRDDDIRVFNFDVNSASLVTLQTWSYGGGMNAQGDMIQAGGFHPVVSLFSSTGMLIDSVSSGSCGPQTPDPMNGLCNDAFLQQNLAAGSYTATLTQFFNVPVGPNFMDGFLQAGTGNFTGPTCSVPGGSFLDTADIDCGQRTNQYALDITGVTTAVPVAAVPEPSTFFLLPPAFLLISLVARRRTASAKV